MTKQQIVEVTTQYLVNTSTALVPVGYQQSEVGLIPSDWQILTINDVAEFSGGSQPPKNTFIAVPKAGYIRLIQIRDYKTSDYETFIPEHLARKKCTATDIMIGRYGPPIFQILRGIEGAYNVALIKANPKKNITRDYLFYCLKSEKLFELMDMLSQRSSGQTGVELPALKAYPIPLPPISEQTVIANALSDVDALILELEKLIAKKQAIKTATMQQLLTGRTRLPQFARHHDGRKKGYKPSELGEIPEDWEVKFVRDVVSEYFCGPSPTCEERNIIPGIEWGVLKTTATTLERGWDWTCHKVLPKIFWGNTRIELRSCDVIVTKAGPRHRVGIASTIDFIPKNIYPSGKMIALRPITELVHPRMLSLSIMGRKSQDYLNERTTGMAEAQLNYENADLLGTPILLQCIEEQTAIAKLITDFDAEIRKLKLLLSKNHQIKQGMMQELLTGKIRLGKPAESA